MRIKISVESIIIPKSGRDHELEVGADASAADVVKKMEEEGLTGSLTAAEVLQTHMLICNSKHIGPEAELKDGDTLMIIKTLLGG